MMKVVGVVRTQYTKWYLISMAVMLGLPWAAVTFAPADAGMAICFILFYAINPIFSILIGAVAASGEENVWVLPCSSATMFIFGTWIFFDSREMIFIVYGCVYLVIGYGSMLVTKIIKRKNVERRSEIK